MAAAPSRSNAGRRRFAVEDMLRWKVAGAPDLSPDGSWVVCPLTVADETTNGYETQLWLVAASSTAGATTPPAPRRLTTARSRDAGPRWSPDGSRIAFVSDRGGTKQIWVIPVDGGEARPLTSGSLSPADLAWSPDSKWVAFVGKPEPADPPSGTGRREPSDVRVISRLHYKQDGEGFWDGRWRQVFIAPASGGAVRQVTQGDYDHLTPAWSPDGVFLAYTGNASPDADLVEAADVWIVPATDGTAVPRRLTRTVGPAESPAWSPDGTQVAYIGHDNEFGGATLPQIWVVPAGGGEPTCVTRGYEGSIGRHMSGDVRSLPGSGGLTWAPDGTRLYFLTTERGTGQVASVAVPDGTIRLETRGDHDLVGCALDRTARRAACVECDPLTPGEIAVAELGPGGPATFRRLSAWNTPLVETLDLVRPERFEYKTPSGDVVDGWVMKPAHAGTGRRLPAVLEIHGGPHSAYGHTFSNQFQLLCAAGYGVVFTNPRGSHGYGQKFLAATHHDWGGGDYQDLMGALDRALAIHEWIDPERLGVAGGSYGGYMTNWIVGHTPRFRAAVTLRSTCNRYNHWGTGDIAYQGARWEWPGAPWESPDFYLARSPITYVRHIKTPLLILHGENDLRCSIEQAEQLFVALKRQGTPVLFVRFPGESHGMSSAGQPRHRLEEMRHLLGWLTVHLDGGASRSGDGAPAQRSDADG